MRKEEKAKKYLKQRKEYKRIIEEIYRNYKNLGRLLGTIKLENLTAAENEVLSPIDHNFHNAREAKLTVKKFVDNFCTSRFKGVDFLEILNSIYLKLKKERVKYLIHWALCLSSI